MKPSSDRKSQERDGPWCHIGMVVEGFADFGLIYAVLEVWHFTVQRHFTVWGWDQLGISWSWNLGSLCMLSCPSRWSFPLISGLTSVILLTEKLGRRSARAGVVIVKLWCMLALTAAGYHLASITAFLCVLCHALIPVDVLDEKTDGFFCPSCGTAGLWKAKGGSAVAVTRL